MRNSVMSLLDSSMSALKYYEYNEYGKTETKGDDDFLNEMAFTGVISEGGDIYIGVLPIINTAIY